MKQARYDVLYGEDARVLEWVSHHSPYRWGNHVSAIGLTRGGELIGAAGYTDYIPGGSVSGHILLKGPLTRKFIHAMLWYPFEQLKVRRLTAVIPVANILAQRFVHKLGFTCEANLARIYPNDDVRVYRLFREDCRVLYG